MTPNARLTWSSNLETGIRQIDLQHQELIEMINELEAAYLDGHDDNALNRLLPRLTTYVVFHFGTEEGMVRKFAAGTPHAEHHLAEHGKFTLKIAAMKEVGSTDKHSALGDLVEYLKSWLLEHIMKTDKELGKTIRAQRAT
ncbi:MAG: hemerythrin family protein [Betaproteobacteria bacterium]|nr:hemerythrin family protein [Betaproteobacteria bacterium]